jgi:hypothetical protein
MQPLPEDVLVELRDVLDNVIRPDLSDSFAREQAALMSNLLEHLRLRITLESAAVAEDCRDVRAVLADTAPEVRDRLDGIEDVASTAVDLPRLRAEAQALRVVLADVVDTLEGAGGDSEQLAKVRGLLRRQLDRERQMIGPGYPRGT